MLLEKICKMVLTGFFESRQDLALSGPQNKTSTPIFFRRHRPQAIIGGSDSENAEKAALDAVKGDEFLEIKYLMLKKLDETDKVSVCSTNESS